MFHWLQSLLAHNGYWVVFTAVFLNNLGFPLPGDSLLLGGGFMAEKGILSFGLVAAMGMAGCFLGSSTAYWLGSRYGRNVLRRMKWFQISPKSFIRMDRFFEKYGPKVVFFARFIALLHPVTGWLAGIWKTPLWPFILYNLAGSAVYAVIYTMVGYFFGQNFEIFKSWLGPAAFYIILIAAAVLGLALFLRHAIRSFFDGFSSRKRKKSP